jgi:hypothetical membrane protein
MAIENLKCHVILALLIFSYSFLAIYSQQKERWRREREREKEKAQRTTILALCWFCNVLVATKTVKKPCLSVSLFVCRVEEGEETLFLKVESIFFLLLCIRIILIISSRWRSRRRRKRRLCKLV